MRVRGILAVALVISALATGVEASAVGADEADQKELTAVLSGGEIVPGPGPERGSGSAIVVTDADEGRLCYELFYEGISDPTAAAVRQAPAGRNGPVVVDFGIKERGDKNCVTGVDEAVLERIAANPAGHYVLISTNEYPDGAIRGQLEPQG